MSKSSDSDIGEYSGCALLLIGALVLGITTGAWFWFILGSILTVFGIISSVYEKFQGARRAERPCRHGIKGADLDPALCSKCSVPQPSRPTRKKVSKKSSDRPHLPPVPDDYFKWPKTAIMPAEEAFQSVHYDYDQGVLSFLGYRVGKSGIYKSQRFKI
jgi:hypothetical protein